APISIPRALFETSATRGLAGAANAPSAGEPVPEGNRRRKLGREERLRQEEAARQQYLTARQRRITPLWERLWTIIIIGLAGSPDATSPADLRALDPDAIFSVRAATWDTQPVVALRLPNQEEGCWLLMPPACWEQILQEWQVLHASEVPAPTPLAATAA